MPDGPLIHFHLSAAEKVFKASIINLEDHQQNGAEMVFSVPLDEVVRIAMNGKYQVATYVSLDDEPPDFVIEESWEIPRSRVLQFASLLRFMASLELDWYAKPSPTASQVLGMADAWALRQGLFQSDADPTAVG